MPKDIFSLLKTAAKSDVASQLYAPVNDEMLSFVELQLDVELPHFLKQIYSEISNGGIGPGYGITGIPGGHQSSWGDLIESTHVLRELEDCQESWVPIIDWGCTEFTVIDCDDDEQVITVVEGDFHFEDYSFNDMLEEWANSIISAE